MENKFEYKTIEERVLIIASNTSLFLIREENITDGNFLIFSDTQPQEQSIQSGEMSISDRLSIISEYAGIDSSIVDVLENTIIEYETNLILGGM